MVQISISYAYQVPGGDLADRFGHNSNGGFSVQRRTSTNWLFGLEGGFLFGNEVVEPGIISNVINRAGQVVDQEGVMADVFLFQRGWTAFATAGKLFNWMGPNLRSGVVLKLGGGYMRHKVRVQTQQNIVPQLEDEYLEGYDRLSAGPAAMSYVGYQHLSTNRRINFSVGLEFTAGFTQPLRAFNFDTETFNSGGRIDLLTGLRVAWILPIDKSDDERFHYY
jgi:hypothetical protein